MQYVRKTAQKIVRKIHKIFLLTTWRIRYSLRSHKPCCTESPSQHEPVVICTTARDEEPYIREWVEYHLQLGFDKIYLYDNNDKNRALTKSLLEDFITAGKLEITDVCGKKHQQPASFRAFYQKHCHEALWCAFLDIDEFITLEAPYTSIQEYLRDVKKHGFSEVLLNWKIYGDNDLVYYSPEPVQKRFTTPTETPSLQPFVKSICYIPDMYCIVTPHFAYSVGKVCQSDFTPVRRPKNSLDNVVYKNAFVRHYFTKTLEEFFMIKLLRGGGTGSVGYIAERLENFYQINKHTPEKTALERQFLAEYVAK